MTLIATRALAATEATLLARSGIVWAATALTAMLGLVWSRAGTSTWASVASRAGMASLVLAGVLLLLGHLAASRDHRYGVSETTASLPAPPFRRTRALLALLPVAAVLGAFAFGLQLAGAAASQPAGPLDPWAALVPIVLPVLGVAVGVSVGRWLPSAAAGGLTLFATTAVLATLPVVGATPDALAWRLFPVELVDGDRSRPAAPGWHLIYLLAVLSTVVAVALLRHRRLVPAAFVVAGLALAVVAIHQTAGPDREAGTASVPSHPVQATRGFWGTDP